MWSTCLFFLKAAIVATLMSISAIFELTSSPNVFISVHHKASLNLIPIKMKQHNGSCLWVITFLSFFWPINQTVPLLSINKSILKMTKYRTLYQQINHNHGSSLNIHQQINRKARPSNLLSTNKSQTWTVI